MLLSCAVLVEEIQSIKTSIISERSDYSVTGIFWDKQWVVVKIQNYISLYFLHCHCYSTTHSLEYFLHFILH